MVQTTLKRSECLVEGETRTDHGFVLIPARPHQGGMAASDWLRFSGFKRTQQESCLFVIVRGQMYNRHCIIPTRFNNGHRF